jgi:acetyltransferase
LTDGGPGRATWAGRTEVAAGPAILQAGELRDARVESLRAIGVLSVLVAHAFGRASDHGVEIPRGAALEAVYLATQAGPFLLFVLSGCLLYGPFARRDLGGGAPVDVRRYAANRVLRILPLYLVMLFVLFAVQEQGGTVKSWLIYGSFSQNFVAFPNQQINHVLWYVVIEVHFYLLLPLLALVIAKASGGSRRVAGSLVAALGAASFAFYAWAWSDGGPDPLWRMSIVSQFFFLAAGMLLAVLRVGWERRPPAWTRGPLGSGDSWIAAGLLGWAAMVAWGPTIPSQGAMLAILVVCSLVAGACVLPLRPGWVGRALGWRPLALVGVASYSLYLWHDPILDALAGSSWAPDGFLGLLAVALPVCGLVTAVSYTVVEAPALRLRKRWVGPKRSAPREGGFPHVHEPAGA